MKKNIRLMVVAAALGAVALPVVAEAQGVVQGGRTGGNVGARAGGNVAGPVGAFVGGATGAVVGGVTGGVNGALGNPYRGKYYRPAHRYKTYKKHH